MGTVTVYRDDWGVPQVYAIREEDGFYGLGYAQAQDRLSGLLRKFLEVQGRSASVFGAEAGQTDLRNLQWMHLEQARAGLSRLEPTKAVRVAGRNIPNRALSLSRQRSTLLALCF